MNTPADAASGLILQFGTSRFLQAHVDLFLHEARQAGQNVPPVAIIQNTSSPERSGRLAAFSDPNGFPVVIRGLDRGVAVDNTIQVRSVTRGLSVSHDWAEIVSLFVDEATFVVSNTADAGYDTTAEAASAGLGTESPRPSYPGKLAQLLYARFAANRRAITILPCELINRNGPLLKGIVRQLAAAGEAGDDFLQWLDNDVIFANTLVDRIVSEPIEPAGAVAEPYALWAIERMPGLVLPCAHPSIVLADVLEPYERLKLHILNLGHTVLADIWFSEARPRSETVREILADPSARQRLEAIYRDEVIPGFGTHGMLKDAEDYVETTMSRFLNPFLDHRIADIAGNHTLKIERRITAFLDWAGTAAPRLEAIAYRNKRKTA